MQRFIICIAIGAVLMLCTGPIVQVRIEKEISSELGWADWWVAVFRLLTEDATTVLMTLILLAGAALFLFGIIAGFVVGVRLLKDQWRTI